MCGCLSRAPTGDPAHNPGTSPDWESNWPPFGSQAGAQSTESHQPGLYFLYKDTFLHNHNSIIIHTIMNLFVYLKFLFLSWKHAFTLGSFDLERKQELYIMSLKSLLVENSYPPFIFHHLLKKSD